MGGPPKTPTGILLARGSWRGKQRVEAGEPQYTTYKNVPQAPPCLSHIEAAEWRRVSKILIGQRVLTHGDRSTLIAYCMAYGEMLEASKAIESRGLLVTGANNIEYVNPAVRVRTDAQRKLLSLASHFGLTPSTRASIKGTSAPEPCEEAKVDAWDADSYIRVPA